MTEAPAVKPIRSPSYPAMSLRDAVEAVAKIEKIYRSSSVDRGLAAKLIGYSSASGPANKALADLAAYGLLERAGKGEARVTTRARAILHASDEQERRDTLLAAALEPDLFRLLTERFEGIAVPPEDGVVTYLNRQGFNPTAVRPAAKAFLSTMEYVAELRASESHGHESSEDAESEMPNVGQTVFGGANVGDFIQWESNGALQLPKPLRVRMVSDDGNWVAVEGSQTGIPMHKVIVESKAPAHSSAPLFSFSDEDPVLPVVKGEIEWMRNRVGQDAHVRLLVTGEMGPKEIGKLIRLLEAQKLVLEDD